MIELMPHQVVGRDFLVANKRALLADEMRVGKSVQTIAAIEQMQADKVLVICPASVRVQWRRQFKSFARRQPGYLRVVSYEDVLKYRAILEDDEWDVLVIDESHYLKGRKSNRTAFMYGEKCDGDGLVSRAKVVWPLSGTPSPNNASELWPMLHALFPETIARDDGKPMNYWQFTKRFCKVVTTPFGEKIEGNRNTEELKRRMSPIMLRRPRTIMGKVRLPSEPLYLDVAKSELDRMRAEIRAALEDQMQGAFDAAKDDKQIDRLYELLESRVKARLSRITGMAKVPALVERLKDEFESGLDKVVLFAWHTDVIEALRYALNRHFGASVIHGSTPMYAREAAIEEFQNGLSRVFIGQIKAAGEGLDLSAACETIFVETYWVPGANDQAAERINGYNQTRPTRVRYAVLPGSIDERLMQVSTRKAADNAALYGGLFD